MQRFKRNQIDEAFRAILTRDDDAESGPVIKTRTRRLLETDRLLVEREGRKRFAFYTKAPPGSGSEVGYSPYEAFALLAGLCFLQLGWPQQTVVQIMRRVRPMLEREHTRIRGLASNQLVTGPAVAAVPRPAGSPVLASSDPVFLAIFAPDRSAAERGSRGKHCVAIARGEDDLMTAWKKQREVGFTSMTTIEITYLARDLADQLDRRPPRARGRKAK